MRSLGVLVLVVGCSASVPEIDGGASADTGGDVLVTPEPDAATLDSATPDVGSLLDAPSVLDAPAAPGDAGVSCAPPEPGSSTPTSCPDRWLACRIATDGSTSCSEVTGTMQPGDECTVTTATACDRNLQCLRETSSGSLVCRLFCYLGEPDDFCPGSQTCEAVAGLLDPNDTPIALPAGVGLCD